MILMKNYLEHTYEHEPDMQDTAGEAGTNS